MWGEEGGREGTHTLPDRSGRRDTRMRGTPRPPPLASACASPPTTLVPCHHGSAGCEGALNTHTRLSSFSSPPNSSGQLPAVPEGYTAITEGKATIMQKAHEVFYNPVQVKKVGK